MTTDTIHTILLCDQVKDELLEKYRNSIPRKAFIEAIDRIKDDLMKED